jgi:hypothetical protein
MRWARSGLSHEVGQIRSQMVSLRRPMRIRKCVSLCAVKMGMTQMKLEWPDELTGHGLEIETIADIQQHGIVVLVLAFYPARQG